MENPQRVGKPLVNDFDGFLSARVGVYRIVYFVDDVVRVVGVVAIGYRRAIYAHPPE